MNAIRIEYGFSNGQTIQTDFTPETVEQAEKSFLTIVSTRSKLIGNESIKKHLAEKGKILPKRSGFLSIYLGSKLVKTTLLGVKLKTTFLEDLEAIRELFHISVSQVLELLEQTAGNLELVEAGNFNEARTQHFNAMYLPERSTKPKAEPLPIVAAKLELRAKLKKAKAEHKAALQMSKDQQTIEKLKAELAEIKGK